MASANSLEDMLSSDVDEVAVNALVGSLESQLSSNINASGQDINSNSYALNHFNNATVDGIRDDKKHMIGLINAPHGSENPPKTTTNLQNRQNTITSSTEASQTNTIMVSLPGALPASGYINQVTGTQSHINHPATRPYTGNSSDIKLMYHNPQTLSHYNPPVANSNIVHTQQNNFKTLANGNTNTMGNRSNVSANNLKPKLPETSDNISKSSASTSIHSMSNASTYQAPIYISTANSPATSIASNQVFVTASNQGDLKQFQPQKVIIKQEYQDKSKLPLSQGTLPTIVTVSKPNQTPISAVTTQQTAVSTTNLVSGVQIVNTGKVGPQGQKAIQPRFILNNQLRFAGPQPILIPRPGTPNAATNVQVSNQQGKIQNIQLPPNVLRGGAILVKSDNGQYQTFLTSNPTSFLSGPGGQANLKSQVLTKPKLAPATAKNEPLTVNTSLANTSSISQPGQVSPTTAKKKCMNFLATLLRLAQKQTETVANNVRNLIQRLVDNAIGVEEFTQKLQKELNSSPQPCLVPFLKKNLSHLQYSLMIKEMTIEGVRPPPMGSIEKPKIEPEVSCLGAISNFTKPAPAVTGPTLAPATPLRQVLTPRPTLVPQRLLMPSVQTTASASTNKLAHLLSSKISPPKPSVGTTREKRSFGSLRTEEDDINDVAAMGGVNLQEESQRILAVHSVGTQLRSCREEPFLFMGPLHARAVAIASKLGVTDISTEALNLVSHATQERLKDMVEKLGLLARHRRDNLKEDSNLEVQSDVKRQLQFLEEVHNLAERRKDEQERELLIRAAKSRSRLDDPDRQELKQRALEVKRAEEEELRHRSANETALKFLGPRKSQSSKLPSTKSQLRRPQITRVHLRDLIFVMEQDRHLQKSKLLYRAYLK